MQRNALKKLIAPFMVVLTLLLINASAISAAEWKGFKDVSDKNEHYEAIKALTEQDILKGYPDGTFDSWNSIQRQHVAHILFKVKDYEIPSDIDKVLEKYSDVSTSDEYAEDIAALTEAGVFKGDHGEFKPTEPINREQMAAVLVKALELDEIPSIDVDINLSNVDSSHQEYVQALANLGLTTQLDAYRPAENTSRGATATLIHRSMHVEVDESAFDLSIMHMNDTHARADQLPKVMSAVKEVRADKPESLLLHAGDVFSGTLYFNEFRGQADLSVYNMMGVDAFTFGNHEFDLGDQEDGQESLADFVKNANFPFLGTNIDFSKDSFMKSVDTNESLVENPEPGKSYNSIVKEVEGEKVGIFGLTTEDTANIASPVDVTFENYLETAEEAVAEFEEAGIDKVVAVTHLGYDSNPAVGNDLLLGQVEGIDVIVGGHSHTELEKPQVVTKDAEGNEKDPTVIVQAGQYSDYLGTVDVHFDEAGVVVGYAGELLEVDSYDADEEATEVLNEYTKEIEELEQEEIGAEALKKLENPRLENEDDDDSVRANETELGNLVTDAMLVKTKEIFPETAIAFQNGGGIRAAIDEGPITVGEVISVLPFGNDPAVVELSGAEIKGILEESVSLAPKENGGFLHVSGMQFTYDSKKEPGERVQEMYVKEGDILKEIKPEEKYLVTTNNFTAKGGDGFDTFVKAYEEGRVQDTGFIDWEQLRDYMVDNLEGKVDPVREDRIVDLARVSESVN